MNKFALNTHHAYLNTEIKISNVSEDEDIEVRCFYPGRMSLFLVKDYYSKYLKAGEYKFVCGDQEEILIIEDAVKLGGSEIKRGFVFDGSPWEFIEMKDRLYLYNRDTKFESVEFGLVPDNIYHLTDDLFLFNTEKNYSIFSTKRMSFVFKCTSSNVFYYDKVLIYEIKGDEDNEERGKVIVYNFIDNKIELEYDGEYSICDKSGYLFLSQKENLIRRYSLKDVEFKEDLRLNNVEKIALFRNFALIQESIKDYGNSYIVYELIKLKSNTFYLPYKIVSFFDKKINDEEIEINRLHKFYETLEYPDPELSFEIKYLDVVDVIDENEIPQLYVKLISIELHKNNEISEIEYYFLNTSYREPFKYRKIFPKSTLLYKNKANNILAGIQISRKFQYNNFLYPIYTLTIYDENFKCIKRYDDSKLIVSIDGSIYYIVNKDDEDVLYNAEGEELLKGEFWINSSLYKDLIIYKQKDKYSILKLKDSNYIEILDNIDSFNEYKFFNGYLFYRRHNKEEQLLAISSSGSDFIFEKDYRIYEKYKNCDSKNILDKTLDTRKFINAFFNSDGKSLTFINQDKTIKNINLDTFIEESFDLETNLSLIKPRNGYNSWIEFSTSRKPVFRDPFTLQEINDTEIGDYIFISPNKKYVAESDKILRYYDIRTQNIISAEDREHLIKRYNFKKNSIITERDVIIRDRQCFINKYKDILFKDFASKKDNEKKKILKENIEDKLDFVSLFVKPYWYIQYEDVEKKEINYVLIGENVWFLNYISFSLDSRYMAVGAKYINNSGIFFVYDLLHKIEVYRIPTSTINDVRAIWSTMFSRNGMVACYDSSPNTYIINTNSFNDAILLEHRSLLGYSGTGKYLALSEQGYIPYSPDREDWGHQPSSNVYLYNAKTLDQLICWNDTEGDIVGLGKPRTVASVAFSKDEKKIMYVTNDGLIIVRNIPDYLRI